MAISIQRTVFRLGASSVLGGWRKVGKLKRSETVELSWVGSATGVIADSIVGDA
jgi:hypothetical protein